MLTRYSLLTLATPLLVFIATPTYAQSLPQCQFQRTTPHGCECTCTCPDNAPARLQEYHNQIKDEFSSSPAEAIPPRSEDQYIPKTEDYQPTKDAGRGVDIDRTMKRRRR